MLIIGLTGGIGSGKSVVADGFKQQGITVVDADIAARKVVEKGSPALQAIAHYFGAEAIDTDGTLNRKYLRSRIFDNPEQKQWLENLLHPLIREWITNQLQQASSPYAILESPLLLETDQHRMVARVLLVDVPETVQVERASNRDQCATQQIRAIMDNQMSRQQRRELADDILDNSGALEKTRQQLGALHQQYLQLAEKVTNL